MCGRLNIVASDINTQVSKDFGIDFCAQQNLDLRPTQWVSALVMGKGGIQQQDANWGIQPAWSKSLLFNAKAETALYPIASIKKSKFLQHEACQLIWTRHRPSPT
jgi:putative SOS response-associated peptidase YedK